MLDKHLDNTTTKTETSINIKEGSSVPCKIINVLGSSVILETGLKSDVVIPKSEFVDEEITIGLVYDCVILSLDDGRGHTIASRQKALHQQSIAYIKECWSNKSLVKGKIIKSIKGGYTVLVKSLKAFLPGSLADFPNDLPYPEDTLEFSIVNIDTVRDNIVVSRVLDPEDSSLNKQGKLLKQLQIGDIKTGVIKNLAPFGAFVNIGFLDGLVYISDISWKRISHPSEVLKIGDEVQVKIIDIKDKRLFLSMKHLTEDPWITITSTKLNKEEVYDAQITSVTSYGMFINLDKYKDIDGLVHFSELSWYSKGKSMLSQYKPGMPIKVKVVSIDTEKRRVAFSARLCTDNPWATLKETYKPGYITEGVITTKTDFGIFINIKGDLDGLVHSSKLSSRHKYKIGDHVLVEILDINVEKRRVEIKIHDKKIKKLQSYARENLHSNVSCKVLSITSDGHILVEVGEDELPGTIYKEKIADQYKKLIEDNKIIDTNISAVITSHNDEGLVLSTIEHHYQKNINTDIKRTTIGNLIKSTLSSHDAKSNKSESEENDKTSKENEPVDA